MNFLKILYFIPFLFLSHSFSQENKYDHEFDGCPLNSSCQQELGFKRKNWQKLLEAFKSKKESSEADIFLNQNGIPIKMWALKKGEHSKDLIFWDSPCKSHRIEGEEIYPAEIFSKNLELLKPREDIVIPNGFLFTSEGNIISFNLLRDEYPSFIKDQDLYYNLFEEGFYYGLKVSQKGELKMVAPEFPLETSQDVACPDSLLNTFEKTNTIKNLYTSAICRAVWNISKKKFETLILGLSCT